MIQHAQVEFQIWLYQFIYCTGTGTGIEQTCINAKTN